MSGSMALQRVPSWLIRRLVVLLPVALVAASAFSFVATREIVAEQNLRLLNERATSVETLLDSTLQSTTSSLKVLGDIADSPEPSALQVFNRVAKAQAVPGAAIGVAQRRGDDLVNLAGAGVDVGRPVSAAREATLIRAMALRTFVATIEPGLPPRVILALPVGAHVVYQDYPLVATGGGDQGSNPFAGVNFAIYSPAGAGELLIATAPTPLRGDRVERPLVIGPDTWTLEVAATTPLVGSLSERIPSLVLGAGLVVALLLWLSLSTLSRRRRYAERLVTERTRELESARQLRENLLRLSPVMVVSSRVADGALTYVSPNVETILGLDAATLQDPAWAQAVVHPDDRTGLEAAAALVRTGDSAQEGRQVRVQLSPTEQRWLQVDLVPERDPRTGDVVELITYFQDISDQRRAEAELRLAHEEAKAANHAKSAFLSSMSHELRTPMNAVLGFAQLLDRDELTPDQQESVGYILTAGQHLLGLIDDVLDFSRIEAGTMTMSPEPVLVAGVVRESLDLVRGQAAARQIRVEELIDDWAPPHARADQQRLKQILVNLLSNAVKYNVAGGSVTVSVVPSATGDVRIDVTDTGPGIPLGRQHELFQPFHRLGAENSHVEGTGIGLALSRQLATMMGATLGVDSAPGRGSTFWIELPAVSAHAPAAAPTPAATSGTGLPGQQAYVLQVEDNPSNVRLLQRVLQHRDDITLLVAETGQQGLELARRFQPRLVLLDLHLPDLDGAKVLARLQQDPQTAGIPTAIISADATKSHREQLLEAGALAYLTKPYDIEELTRLIDSVLVPT